MANLKLMTMKNSDMNILVATARWYKCYLENDSVKCYDCPNYIMVDPRTDSSRGTGPSTTGQRRLCDLLKDLDNQLKKM